MDTQEFLAHYGVKGMQWGVRRSPKQLARAAKKFGRSRKETKDKTRYSEGPKNLTNEELKERIQRMETEKRYNDLNSKTVSEGQKHINDVLTNVGKQTIQNVAAGVTTSIAAVGAAKLLEKHLKDKSVADTFRKKAKVK